MTLNYSTLNHNTFTILDSTLFLADGLLGDSGRSIGLLERITSRSANLGRNNAQGCIDWYSCGTRGYCTERYGPTGCDYTNCPTDECFLMQEYCFDLPSPGGGSGNEDPGPGGPPAPGGGGSGGGGTPPDPCDGPTEPFAGRGDLPCIEDPVWEPEEPSEPPVLPPPPNPCDGFITALTTNATFASNFKSLMTPANLNANFEQGYIINFTTGRFELKQGQAPTTPGMKGQVNLGSNTPVSGTIHNHLTGFNTMFTTQDVVNQMAKLFVETNAQDPKNLFCGLATENGPYLLKVVDSAKFSRTANKIYSLLYPERAEQFKRAYEDRFNWVTDSTKNEAEFLYMLSAYGGLALYKGNADCNEWSALSVSSDTHNNQVEYTINKKKCN